MDKLDKLSITSLIILIIVSSLLLFRHGKTAQTDQIQNSPNIVKKSYSPEFDIKIKTASSLLANNNLEKGELLINSLISEYPYEGAPYMVLGDLYLRKQDPLHAMLAYKDAIQYNPDYLDKKTSVFQGKKIKNTVKEARVQVEKLLKNNPSDRNYKKHRKTVYFMLRKIAGSCG